MPGIHNPEAFALLRKRAGFEQPLPVFVETGTWHGRTLAAALASGEFKELHSVEISQTLWADAVKNFRKFAPKVKVHLGDSADVVPVYLAAIPLPIFWYLDAHWWDTDPPLDCPPDRFPLWNELAAIRARDRAELLIVDDIQAFAAADERVPKKDWGDVTRYTITSFLGSRVGFTFDDDNRFIITLRGK